MSMKQVNLDLGEDIGKEPSGGSSVVRADKYYPSFHYSTDYDLMDDFPKKGKMVIEYEVIRSTETTDEDGKEHYECDIRVKKIVSVDRDVEAPASNGSEAADALDAIRELLEKQSDEKSDESGAGY